MRAVLKKASSGTRRVFRSIRCKKQASTVRKRYSVPKTGFSGTRRTFKGALNGILSHRTHLQRPAEQPTPQTVDSPLPDRTHLQRRAVPKAAPAHRTQLQCAKRPPLSLFAPAPSTIFFVPLTRNLSPADPSPAPSTALGTGNGPLRYRICVPCSKRPPPVRDAFSEAFGVKNRLFRYGRDIRCTKQASVVRDAFQRPAEQPTPQTVDSLLPHWTHLQRPAAPVLLPTHAYIAAAVPSSKKIKKEDVFLGKVLEYTPSIKLYDLIISPEIWRPEQLQDVR